MSPDHQEKKTFKKKPGVFDAGGESKRDFGTLARFSSTVLPAPCIRHLEAGT